MSKSKTSSEDITDSPGLGTLLRKFVDILDRGSDVHYQNRGVVSRARYTPIMRVLDGEPVSVSILCDRLGITQGAVSQTVKLMEADGLIARVPTDDSRSRAITLTQDGKMLREKLVPQWQLRLTAIADLEQEIDIPLRTVLEQAIEALEREGFADRLTRLSKEAGLD